MINRRLALLVVAAGGLAAYGVWSDESGHFKRLIGTGTELANSAPAIVPDAPRAVAAPAKSLNPLDGLAVEALSAISERPLFNPTRAPAPQEQQVATEPAQVAAEPQPTQTTFNPDEYTLLAIASSKTGKIALVRRNTTNEVFHIKQGESLSEWQVVEVSDRQISVGVDGQTIELKMFGKRTDVPNQPAAQNEPDAQQSSGEAANQNNEQSANPLRRSGNRTQQLPQGANAENQMENEPQISGAETDQPVDGTDPSLEATDQSDDGTDQGDGSGQ